MPNDATELQRLRDEVVRLGADNASLRGELDRCYRVLEEAEEWLTVLQAVQQHAAITSSPSVGRALKEATSCTLRT